MARVARPFAGSIGRPLEPGKRKAGSRLRGADHPLQGAARGKQPLMLFWKLYRPPGLPPPGPPRLPPIWERIS